MAEGPSRITWIWIFSCIRDMGLMKDPHTKFHLVCLGYCDNVFVFEERPLRSLMLWQQSSASKRCVNLTLEPNSEFPFVYKNCQLTLSSKRVIVWLGSSLCLHCIAYIEVAFLGKSNMYFSLSFSLFFLVVAMATEISPVSDEARGESLISSFGLWGTEEEDGENREDDDKKVSHRRKEFFLEIEDFFPLADCCRYIREYLCLTLMRGLCQSQRTRIVFDRIKETPALLIQRKENIWTNMHREIKALNLELAFTETVD